LKVSYGEKHMNPPKKHVQWLFFALLTIGIAVVPEIRAAGQNTGKDINQTELQNFHSFLNGHAQIRADLTKNPALINDSSYLQKHPQLAQFLQAHPGVAEQVKRNPGAFLQREGAYEAKTYGEQQPDMEAALQAMHQAKVDLEKGAQDKGGHRMKAIQLLEQAEAEVRAAIQYANTH